MGGGYVSAVHGSSPLARGLPGRLTGRARPSEDHPRSRGVYSGGRSPSAPVEGSSPLARGLRAARRPARGGGGIIPARAGFTRRSPRPSSHRTDHPRSRGVYPTTRRPWTWPPGSSPLARGLQLARRLSSAEAGIIPARAGFTHGHYPAVARARDHPRSRGVYSRSRARAITRPGSSPLARGLLEHVPAEHRALGIIPARAGFTTLWSSAPGLRIGSSPLARGLRGRPRGGGRPPRIIPARAGFTRPRPARPAGCRDHPRSRGVYRPLDRRLPGREGSSPLARGLQRARRSRPTPRGIIPARAGFTRPRRRRGPRARDHPRSRGVYGTPPCSETSPRGSSPLARGLLEQQVDQEIEPRIIPARAGFTHLGDVGAVVRRDHPRSRGVYTRCGRWSGSA